ncbi:MAG TPA: tetratricopeptide repeat protein, partial [Nitrospirota bacterium]|nr:tetratricopeptide repeat protein [Nitrospirota bacterium]
EERIPDLAPDAALGLARSLTGAMDLAAAARAYQEVYVAYPGDPRDEEVMTALTLFRESGIETPGFTADQLSLRGKNLFRARQYEKATAAFSAALEKDPQHPQRAELSLKTGVSLFHLGRRAEAMQVLERSLMENAKDGRGPESLNWLGKTYSRMGEREKAVKTYLRIVSDYPESEWADDALYLIGNIYRDANDRLNTLKFYDRLAEEFPGSPFADSAIWWKAWSQYAAGDYGTAEQTLRTLVNRYPRSFLVNQAVYWQGRACERRGDTRAAAAHYQRVLKRSPYTYYGYLAAERLSRIEADVLSPEAEASTAAGADADAAVDTGPPDWTDDEGPPVWTGEAVQLLSAEPSFRKALELMHLEMKQEAAAELGGLQERLQNKRRTVLGMSKTFFELGDYYRSFILVARNYEKLLEGPAVETPRDLWLLAYPQGYWDSIVAHARAYGQDPYFIASIIRQESHFQADAISPAGARGLMQVMPSTGEWAARMIRLNGGAGGNLYDADRNIRLGTWYVSRLMKRYRNDPFLVAAAYNAGPAVASSWLGKYGGTVEKDELVELIPYNETRWYVKRVLTNYAEYRRIYGRSGKPLRFLSARADAAMWQDEEVEVP